MMTNEAHADRPATTVERNIHALVDRRNAEEHARTLRDRIADTITRFTGSMTFVYLHLLLFGAWIIINLPSVPLGPKFDPSFVVLAMVASVEAIFLSTFVLITQNRMATLADKRADLDLQVSLLAEREVTRVLVLVSRIAERLGIDQANDPELAEMKTDIAPEQVLDAIEHVTKTKGA